MIKEMIGAKAFRKYLPEIASWLLLFSGIFNIISVFRDVTTSIFTRSLIDYFPISVTSRSATLVIGVLLISTSRGLSHKNKNAWKAALTLTLISLMLHFLKGFNFEEALFSLFILVSLIWTRQTFNMESHLTLNKETIKDFLSSMIIFLFYFILGKYFLKNTFAIRVFQESLLIIPSSLTIVYLLQIFENLIILPPKSSPLEILPILKQYGYDTLSYFSTNSKKEIFFSPDRQAFLAYALKRDMVIVSGDPVGPKNLLGPLLGDFIQTWKSKNVKVAFYGLSNVNLTNLQKLGYKYFMVGEEAIVNVSQYDFDRFYTGGHGKRFRRAIRHIQDLGFSFEFMSLSQLPATYYSQMVEISRQWLDYFSIGKEVGFAMNLSRLPGYYDEDCRIALAIEKNKTLPKVIGFLVFTPVYNQNGYSLDIMRRIPGSPNGLNEFLIVNTINQMKIEGKAILSLNFAVLSDKTGKLATGLINLLTKRIKNIKYIQSLYVFNQKFFPDWFPRYLAYENLTDLPNILVTIFELEGMFNIDLNLAQKIPQLLKLSK